jgi:serine/threonine protein kinase
MPLSPGDKLGPYEILGLIGKGGMGEVYRAHDPRTGRDVAVKISAERFNERFDREVRAVAALNHPNICTLYDVGPNYLVMEFIEGESPKGPMPLEEALQFAGQIAAALAEAHEKGITHRDLKPGNIKIKPDGTVKVLDFGLAKITPAESGATSENSPTISIAATQAGVILGTAAYMSPEQARGRPVDKRADIWAFGVVLYELLTGRRPFHGEDVTETLASVVKEQPNLSAAPQHVRRLLQRCLEKDPRKRLRDIGDVWELLEEKPQPAPSQSRLGWVGLVAAVFAVATVTLGFLYFRKPAEAQNSVKFSVLAPENTTFPASNYATSNTPKVSPDGRRLAFVARMDGKDGLWVRDLDSLTARLLPGTAGATGTPFWSPDNRWIAFFADLKLKKIEVSGTTPPLTLCDAINGLGGSWSKDDVVVFAILLSGLLRVPAAGGNPSPATTLDPASSETAHTAPWFLPDGHHFLYTALPKGTTGTVYIGDLDSKTRNQVLMASSDAIYTPPGYVLFLRERSLMAQPFDASAGITTGDAVPVGGQMPPQARFSSSQNGVLAYTTGVAEGQLTWFDRSGKPTGTVSTPGLMNGPAISPDGKTVAFTRTDSQTGLEDVWLHDLVRGTDRKFTFTGRSFPVWSPDGSHIAFNSTGAFGIYQKAVAGAAPEESLDKEQRIKRPTDWSRDYLVEDSINNPETGADILLLPMTGDRKLSAYLKTAAQEFLPKLSPNGRWLAYVSDEQKRTEIFVQTFPTPGDKWQISSNGGLFPVWSRDGKELYFIGADQKLMAVDMKDGPDKADAPKPLFDIRLGGGAEGFDVSGDGRFLIPTQVTQGSAAPITVVVNWQTALKK